MTADQYLAAISKKVDKVRDADISVEDEELALFVLDDLNSSYDAFITAVTTTSGEISFSKFKGLLKAHKAQMLRDSSRLLPSANFIQISSQSKSPTTPITNSDSLPVICHSIGNGAEGGSPRQLAGTRRCHKNALSADSQVAPLHEQ